MPQAHKRTPLSEQRRQAKRLILRHAFQDQQRAETVNILTPTQILTLIGEGVMPGAVPVELKGEVLIDSRGQGTLQK